MRLRMGVYVFAVVGGALSVQAGNRTIVLREHVGQSWSNELVSYSFSAKKGESRSDSFTLTGPEGPVPVQLSDIEYWPRSQWVKSARLNFVAGLPPLATRIYTVTWGKQPAPIPTVDLAVTRKDSVVEITTERIGVRLLEGQKTYEKPEPASEVPGPLAAFRLAGGTWSGGSRLYGDTPIVSYSARLTDDGPVFARMEFLYTYADNNTLRFTAQVAAGDSAALWDMRVKDDRPANGVEFTAANMPGVNEVRTLAFPRGISMWPRSDGTRPASRSEKPIARLAPPVFIAGVLPDSAWAILFPSPGGGDPAGRAGLQLRSRDAAAWADPIPFTYAGFSYWDLDMIPKMWEVWGRKRMPLTYGGDGAVCWRASLARGGRKWSVSSGPPLVGERLNGVNDMVLDWPEDPEIQHPRLFLSRDELRQALGLPAGSAMDSDYVEAVQKYLSVGNANVELSAPPVPGKPPAVRSLLGSLSQCGHFDVMRYSIAVMTSYDALIGADVITPAERSLLRAQAAYLAYYLADPVNWSPERGYITGNPNMTCSLVMSLGVAACVLADHPMAIQWATYANNWMRQWLANEVGPNGEWIPEGAHYNAVSFSAMLAYAIAAKRAGYADFLSDPAFKRLGKFFARIYTPPDPKRGRGSPPYGRGVSGERLGLFGVLARATAESDPGYSQLMQWMWAQTGYPTAIGDVRMGGLESLYVNRGLPMKTPRFGSELFPQLGVIFRNGFGGERENYVGILSHVGSRRNLDVWVPGVGEIWRWYARSKPVASEFQTGVACEERHELLRNGVLLARNWGAPEDPKEPFGYYTTTKPEAFAALPRADYVRATYSITEADDRPWFPSNLPAWPRVKPAGEPRLTWTRQVLFMKDANPEGPNYLVFRDTVSGGQPTLWQFWSLSEKIGTPDQVRDVTAFLADRPAARVVAARGLPGSDRYTAVGQDDVDLEFYVAEPADTPRHTLRYGATTGYGEFQDLLHLQLPGDGGYFVEVFPRYRTEVAPAFGKSRDGRVIKVMGDFGTDYAFLSATECAGRMDDAEFTGTAGSVHDRKSGLTLALPAGGGLLYKEYALSAPLAASLQVEGETAVLSFPPDHGAGEVILGGPGQWRVEEGTGAQAAFNEKKQLVLAVSAGTETVKLTAGR